MNILAFDTSGEILSVALLFGERSREISIDQGMRHVQSLMPEIDRITTESGIDRQDIDLIVTARGPGSFTGLRIGIATAKGLSEALAIPFVTVPSLDVLAYPKKGGASIPILPLIDARKGRFYGALYRGNRCTQDDNSNLADCNSIADTSITAPSTHEGDTETMGRIYDYFDLAPEEIIALLSDADATSSGLYLTGPGAPIFYDSVSRLIPEHWLLDPLCRKGNALTLAILGKATYTRKGGDKPGMGPLYLRKSEAELSRKK